MSGERLSLDPAVARLPIAVGASAVRACQRQSAGGVALGWADARERRTFIQLLDKLAATDDAIR